MRTTKAYIRYRLSIAGRNESIYTEAALMEIYKTSQGLPRSINNLCDLSLVIGFGKHLQQIDIDTIVGIVESEK